MAEKAHKQPRVVIVSMGCSKNLVDSERLAKMFQTAGFDVTFDSLELRPDDIIVINTCGFIGDAKEESINMLLEALSLKEMGKVAKVYVMGCLSQRYPEELKEEMPDLDGIFGKFDWPSLVDQLKPSHPGLGRPWERVLSTSPHQTFLKISEGCNRFCAFCAIPLITGRHHSRTEDDIVAEVEALASSGTKEFNIIAQDLSSYGRDLSPRTDGRSPLAALVDRLADIPGVEWLRLHYAYPADFPFDVLEVMARRKNVCKYLDIALQHIDDRVLDNMQRHVDAATTRDLLHRIREAVPGIHIRTTLMVGFPGEDEEAFERLVEFVREQRFERMGAFAYCEEDDTFAAKHYKDDIPEDVKQQRLSKLMAVQEEIAFEHNEAKVGQTLRVIIDEEMDDYFVGRTEYDSPEVDCNVLVSKNPDIKIGEIYNVRIDSAEDFDLSGTVVAG